MYEIFGVPENATFQEITEAYRRLRAQYAEERFAEGEKGNEASRRLMELEQAYEEGSRRFQAEENARKFGSDFGETDAHIKAGRLSEAQSCLDDMTVRAGEWHYYQSMVFYKRGWYVECRKQLTLALTHEPANPKYIVASEKLDQFLGNVHLYEDPRNRRTPPPQNNQATDSCAGLCCETCLCLQCLYCCN
jgi:hypothetical protein